MIYLVYYTNKRGEERTEMAKGRADCKRLWRSIEISGGRVLKTIQLVKYPGIRSYF